jgi:hypothetical protein
MLTSDDCWRSLQEGGSHLPWHICLTSRGALPIKGFSSVNRIALDRAIDHLGDARSSFDRLKRASTLAEAERDWSSLLINVQRTISKLAAGAKEGSSAGWFGKIRHDQRHDPLVQYMHQARHADEHGVDRVAEARPGGVKLNPADPTKPFHIGQMIIDRGTVHMSGGSNVFAVITPGELALKPVLNEGRIYNPPTAHRGEDLTDRSLLGVATKMMSYLEGKVAEAEALPVKP